MGMKETGRRELRKAMESSLMQMEMYSRGHTSGEIVMALASLSRAMGRREMKIIKRENSSTLLSLKMLSEQNIFINLKFLNKKIFVTFSLYGQDLYTSLYPQNSLKRACL